MKCFDWKISEFEYKISTPKFYDNKACYNQLVCTDMIFSTGVNS